MSKRLRKAWQSRGALACLLWPVSLVYGLLSSLQRASYRLGFKRAVKVAVPVLVVGNVVAGGAGKTPLVMALVRHFQQRGFQVGVVSRGYGRASDTCMEVDQKSSPVQAGDEPLLIKRTTGAPVFVARKRSEAAQALLAAYPPTQLIICDDGLQHLALARDVEITVFDDQGIGNGWLLPAGPLREPWPRKNSAAANLVLHTGQKPAFAGFKSSRRLADHAMDAKGNSLALATLCPTPVMALAGIANPDAFFGMLRAAGLRLSQTIELRDHDDFSGFTLPEDEAATVLCTEKDAVKLFAMPEKFAGRQLLAVPLEFLPEPAFFTALDELMVPLLSQLPLAHGHKTA